MFQLARIAAGRSLFDRLFASALQVSRRVEQVPLSPIAATSLPSPDMRTRPRVLLGWVAALLATFAMAAPASAQQPVMTITGATPSSYSGPGQTITFHVTLGGSNAVTNSVELTRIAYGTVGPINCVGLPLDPLESTTCSFTYVTQATDFINLNQSGTFRVTTLNAPRTRNIANSFVVPYIPPANAPSASLSVAPASVSEDGAANLVYTVTLSAAATVPTTMNYSVGGTATSGSDYAAVSGSVTIPTGSTTGTITVNPTADTAVEPDETVTVDLLAGSGYTPGAPTSASGTISNDDLPGLSINDVALAEGNAGTTNATFTVSLNQPAGPAGVSFSIATANNTASSGSDYVANSLSNQTIPAGSSTYTFTVPVNGDTLNEPNETFFVNVTGVTGASVSDGQGVGTINNDDAQPSLSIGSVSVVEGNAGTTNAVFTVNLSAASGQAVSVNFATGNGTATAPGDYTAQSGALNFAPGQTTRTITVVVLGDGQPETNETFTVGLSSAVNAAIGTATGTGTITNDDVPVSVSPASLPAPAVGVAYNQAVGASGGSGSYTFAVISGALPAGLTLSTSGTLSGTPMAGGNFVFRITATDASAAPGPYTGSLSYSVVVAAPTISLPAVTLTNATRGQAYNAALSPASGGTASYSYAVTAGALPAGVSVSSSSGDLSGTPTEIGTFNFTVTATDSSTGTGPYTGSRAYALVVDDQLPVANAVSASVAYGSGQNPITLNITGGTATSVAVAAAPANGIALASGTSIGYQPNANFSGTDSFTYTASNGTGTSAPATVTVTVNDPTITLAASGPLAAAVSIAYTQTFTWTGGTTPFTGYQVTGLPAGLSITGTGANSVTVSGTPTQAGSFNLTVSATDSSVGNGPFTVGQVFALTVAAPTVALAPATTTFAATYNAAFSQAFTASGGVGPYSYALVGTLPAGISFSDNSLIGTPTAPGSYNFTVTATDTGSTGTGAPFSVSENYTLTVGAPTVSVDPPTLPAASAGVAYSQTLTASGGVAPYSFTVNAGSLPSGLNLTAGGVLSGTPSASGTFNFTVTASDANGQTGAAAYTLTIAVPTLNLSPGTLPAGTAGSTYTQTLVLSGGIAPYVVTQSGTLPAGLSFNTGTLSFSGTPTEAGNFNLSITASDSTGGTAATVTNNYTLTIASPTLALTPAALPTGTAGIAYHQTLTASGGIAPYRYAVSAGSLPAGLSLTAAGQLSGTPTVAGSFTFSVTATDSTTGVAGTVAHSYTLVLASPTLVITPATVPNGVRGIAYTQTLGASGGTAGYTFAVTAGTLPAGLTLSAAGVLGGTPTAAASNNFTVTATDALGFSANQAYTQVIAEAVPIANADAATTLGVTAATVAVTSNDTGLIDSIAVTTAPAHGAVTVNGLTAVYIANADFSGTDTFAYTATGPGGTSAPALVTITVNPVAVAVSRTVAVIAGLPITVDLTQGATGGPFTAATLVALTPATSGTANIAQIGTGASAIYRLTYTPVSTYSGAATASFTLSNAFSTSAQAVITFNVAPRPDPTQDAEVRGLLNAQVASTRRFATSQMNNFQQRLERLHGAGERNGFDNGLSVATDQRCEQRVGAIPGRSCDRNSPGDEFDGGNGPAGSGLQNAPANALGNDGVSGPAFGVWAGGMIRSGNQDGRNGSASVDFETDGVSLGADYRFNDSFVLGAGVGYGRDDSDIGEHGSRSEGDAFTVAAYASYSPGDRFFLDGLVGYQQLNYDLRRYLTVNANTVEGSRDGDQWFASVSAGADLQKGDWQLTPYARVDVAQATLDGYTESGDALYSLAYGDMDVDTTTGNLGLRADYRMRTGWGLFSPQLRLEYQHDFQGNGAATMQYADFLTGPVYRAELDDFDRNRVNVGLGGLFGFDTWSLRLEYRGLIGSGGDSDHGVLLNIEKRL